MKKFKRKSTPIEAIQWFPGTQIEDVYQKPNFDIYGFIMTPSGEMSVVPGDWIITVDGVNKYPCSQEIFDFLYEPV